MAQEMDLLKQSRELAESFINGNISTVRKELQGTKPPATAFRLYAMILDDLEYLSTIQVVNSFKRLMGK